jgi:hypothetical protein
MVEISPIGGEMNNILTRWQRLSAGLEPCDPGTFLAQGAFGGGVACFLVTLFRIVYPRSIYNYLLIYLFLFYLLPSMTVGVVIAGLVWLLGWLRHRKPGFLSRFVIGVATTSLIAIAYSVEYGPVFDTGIANTFRYGMVFNWHLFLWSLIPASLAGLLTGLITGSKLNPLRVIVLGPAKLTTLRRFSSWFASAAGFPLRVGSFLGTLLALLLLAYFFSTALAGYIGFAHDDDRKFLVGTILALLYLAISDFASFTLLRRIVLVGLAALLNAPLAVWILSQSTPADTNYLAIFIWLFISGWILLIVARMIVPDSKGSGADYTNTQSATCQR